LSHGDGDYPPAPAKLASLRRAFPDFERFLPDSFRTFTANFCFSFGKINPINADEVNIPIADNPQVSSPLEKFSGIGRVNIANGLALQHISDTSAMDCFVIRKFLIASKMGFLLLLSQLLDCMLTLAFRAVFPFQQAAWKIGLVSRPFWTPSRQLGLSSYEPPVCSFAGKSDGVFTLR
jgi:hypothetical protein